MCIATYIKCVGGSKDCLGEDSRTSPHVWEQIHQTWVEEASNQPLENLGQQYW